MLNEVYQRHRPTVLEVMDPAEHAAHEIHSAIATLVNAVNSSTKLPQLWRIEQLLKPLAVELLAVQDVLGHREHVISVKQ